MTYDILERLLANPWAIPLAIFFFGASIFVHELGHFLAARWRGLKIDRFSIGFGPRLFGWKGKDDVDYRVSALPLGGYVALPQLADMRGIEGDPTDNPQQLPPISYTDKMIVAGAGAVFNVIFAFFLATILWVTGISMPKALESTMIGEVLEEQQLPSGDVVPGAAFQAGVQPGDEIVAIDGAPVDDWQDVITRISTGAGRAEDDRPMLTLTLERGGEEVETVLYPRITGTERLRTIGVIGAMPRLIADVSPHSPAEVAGLQPGDEIVAVDGQTIYTPMALSTIIEEDPDRTLALTVQRGDEVLETSVRPEMVTINTDGERRPMIGIQWDRPEEIVHVDPLTQVQEGVEATFIVLGALVNPQSNIGLRNLSGPVGIGHAIYRALDIGIDWVLFLVVLINVNLAILNLLPIPVLDGGHMAFATVQKITGRPLPARFIAATQTSFMLLLFSLVIYVTFFDVRRVGRAERGAIEAERAQSERVPIEFTRGLEENGAAQPND